MWSYLSSFVYLIWIVNAEVDPFEKIDQDLFPERFQPSKFKSGVGQYYMGYETEKDREMNLFLHNKTLFKKPLPETIEVVEGNPLELKCEVIGRPAPQIFWSYGINQSIENQVVSVSANEQHEIGKDFSLVTSKLVIGCVKTEDQGPIECISMSGNEQYVSKTELIVKPNDAITCKENDRKPIITMRARLIFSYVNSTATLPCRFTDKPITDFHWYKESEMMDLTKHDRYTMLSNGDLQIENLQPSDMAEYACVLSSEFRRTGIIEPTFLYPLLYVEEDRTSKVLLIKVGKSINGTLKSISAFSAPLLVTL